MMNARETCPLDAGIPFGDRVLSISCDFTDGLRAGVVRLNVDGETTCRFADSAVGFL